MAHLKKPTLMKKYIFILLLFFGLTNCQSQPQTEIERQKTDQTATSFENPNIQVEIHSRVDTTKHEIKEIATLWTNYLNSEPDKVSDNPYWNEAEKLKYKDFDFSRRFLYQVPSDQLLRNYIPKILSIEKEGDHYGIRTMYSADGLEGEYRKSDPWAIQKLYAVREDNQWRLKNSLPIITNHWNRKTIGKITFIYSPYHPFNEALAVKANEFCNQVKDEFKFPDWEPFDFYITESGDELGRLLNFDFFAAGYTTGVGLHEKRILLSGIGSEYYPHEFIHLIVPQFERHGLMEEGFATWKGGQDGKTFEESVSLFANELSKNDTVTFLDVLNRQWGWQYAAFYTTGAIFCNSAYQKGGVNLVNELLKIPNDSEKLVDNLCLIFDIEKKDFDDFWRNETLNLVDD
jgi:hypothetical protein